VEVVKSVLYKIKKIDTRLIYRTYCKAFNMLYCCWFPTTRWCVWADRPVGLLAVLDSDHDDDDDDRQHHEPPDTHRRYETHTQRLLTETSFNTMSMLL